MDRDPPKDEGPGCFWIGAGLLAVAFLIVLIVAYVDKGKQEERRREEEQHRIEASKVDAPPCIHEVCAERPGKLVCIAEAKGFRESYCGAFVIEYEHHCDCDQWGPAP